MSDSSKTQKSRQTLKNYFSAGSLPEERHFHDLIDSTLNMEDEGFNKTSDDGLQVFTKAGESGAAGQSLISFYREGQKAGGPLWRIRFDRGLDALQVVHPPDETTSTGSGESGTGSAPPPPLLSFAPGRRLGVNQARPEADLDVGGLLRSRSRSGVVPEGIDVQQVLADGAWHAITGQLTGCHALEVLAGAGGVPGRGNYALLHAIALNAYQPRGWLARLFRWKNPIKVHQTYYRSRADKLQLRWTGDEAGYRLEVRTRSAYQSEKNQPPARILFHVTHLWQYPTMRPPEVPSTEVDGQAAPDEPPTQGPEQSGSPGGGS